MVTTRSQTSRDAATTTTTTRSAPKTYTPADPRPSTKCTPRKPRQPTADHYGLIQERLQPCSYALLVQAILWNQTTGRQARPVLDALLALYPTPALLSAAPLPALTALLQPIGLHNVRAARLLAFADAWLAAPPHAARRYRRRHYPSRGGGCDVRPGEVLDERDAREGWEVAHLPGVGAYALDSWRIFARDVLRGEPDGEWTRVVPLDKELRAYLVWRWARHGWKWDPLTGRRKRMPDDASGP